MEKDISFIEDLICEYNQSDEKEKYRQARALENLLTRYKQLEEYLGEIDSKEVSDALHMLLSCSLKDTRYETQKEQFKIVNTYIKQLEEENKNLIKANVNKKIRTYKEVEKYFIPKSKVKEKIESHYPDVACQKLTELLREE